MQSLRHASLCDETSIMALISDDFTENGKCNFYTIADRFLVTSGVMAFQVRIPSAITSEGLHRFPKFECHTMCYLCEEQELFCLVAEREPLLE